MPHQLAKMTVSQLKLIASIPVMEIKIAFVNAHVIMRRVQMFVHAIQVAIMAARAHLRASIVGLASHVLKRNIPFAKV